MSNHDHILRNEKKFNRPEHMPPYWRRMHRDWRFWVGLIAIFTAIFIYIMTEDLSIQPASIK